MACFNPVWASEMTSCTPPSPRAFNERKKGGPERAVLRVADREAEDLSPAVGPDAGGDHYRLRQTRQFTRAWQ